jgi:hypothetical protein
MIELGVWCDYTIVHIKGELENERERSRKVLYEGFVCHIR